MKKTFKHPVALLGASGPVGQKAILLIERSPLFYLAEVISSDKRLGHSYEEEVEWREVSPLPSHVGKLLFKSSDQITSKFILSALPSSIACTLEAELATRGHLVFSNASSFRLDKKVPLLIPEINESALSLLETQHWNNQKGGKIITNPNCTTVFFVGAIAPILKAKLGGELLAISVTTLQAISGAGYPGVASLDITSNTIPYIDEEEEKILKESKKILAQTYPKIKDVPITVNVNRVPVANGHTVITHLYFKEELDLHEVKETFLSWNHNLGHDLYELHSRQDRPQAAKDLDPFDFKIHIGRIRHGERKNILSLISLGHNLVRGAAGAALRNMEHYCDINGITPEVL